MSIFFYFIDLFRGKWFEQLRRWGPFITVFAYHKDGKGQITVSFRQTFKDRSEYDNYD